MVKESKTESAFLILFIKHHLREASTLAAHLQSEALDLIMVLGKGLHPVDYAVFSLGIFASLAAGIFYAFKERKHVSSYHFHRGGGKLKALPVAMSMLVTFESSIFFLGFPAEVYVHGFLFWIVNIGMALGFSSMFWITIPLFYPLQVTSVYEYLQMRFDSLIIRQLAMSLGVIYMTLYSGIVLFGAAIALQSVTGVSVWIYIVAMSVIAVIYTSLGGIKAVVVTDVVQGIIMIAVIFAVLIYGTINVGGVQTVIDLNKPSGRLKMVDFDPSPFTRHTFWTLIVGTFGRTLSFSCKQPVIQRLNSTKSMNEARKVAALSIPGFVILQILVMFEGLVAYAYFAQKGCDPLASGQISNPNQIISFAVMDMFENIPGITGLFLAALCSASLSTISSLLSSVSAIVAEDVIRPKWKTISDITLTKASKGIVLLCGAVCIGVGLVISNVKGPMPQISGSILGAIDGPVLALFIMSIFIKFSTKRGILASITVGMMFALWLSLGYNFSPGRKRTPWLPLGPTDKCYNNTDDKILNYTSESPINFHESLSNVTYMMSTEVVTAIQDTAKPIKGIDNLYSISYLYFSLMISIVSLTVGITVSKCTKPDRKQPVPSYLMLGINKRFFRCQPNYEGELDNGRMPESNVMNDGLNHYKMQATEEKEEKENLN